MLNGFFFFFKRRGCGVHLICVLSVLLGAIQMNVFLRVCNCLLVFSVCVIQLFSPVLYNNFGEYHFVSGLVTDFHSRFFT